MALQQFFLLPKESNKPRAQSTAAETLLLSLATSIALTGCLSSFARIDGARTIPPRGASASFVLGGQEVVGYQVDNVDSSAANCGSGTGTGSAQSPCKQKNENKTTTPNNDRKEFSPASGFLIGQLALRTGVTAAVDCGLTVALMLGSGIGTDCKWNWLKDDRYAIATSLGVSGAFQRFQNSAGGQQFRLLSTEARFPGETWIPLGASRNSALVIMTPFAGYYGIRPGNKIKERPNWETAPFAGVESFVGFDFPTPRRWFEFRVGVLGWYLKPFGFAYDVTGLAIGGRFAFVGKPETNTQAIPK